MLTELRRYAVQPGQMDAMHARMHDLLLPMFGEHGIPIPRAIWDTRGETSILSWLVDWPDFETRLNAWTRFAPHFVAARQAEGTPEIVTRTTLTVIAPWSGHSCGFASEGLCETAWHVQPQIGYGAAFTAACQEEAFERFRAAGASAVNACNFLFGPLPQAMVLVTWPDETVRATGLAKIRSQALGLSLAQALTGEGETFADRGAWEDFDRAPYLAAWRPA